MEHNKAKSAEHVKNLDEGQRRMIEAAEKLLKVDAVHERVHEYDADCQPELRRM